MKTNTFLSKAKQSRRAILQAVLAIAALQAPAFEAAAQPEAAGTHIAVASILGDSFSTVTRQDSTGSHIDANLRNTFKVPDGVFDTPALLAMEQAVKKGNGRAEVSLLKLAQSEALADAGRLSVGASFEFPAGLAAAFKQIKATHFLLLTPARGQTMIKGAKDGLGSGWLDGVGFFVDRNTPVNRVESSLRRVGYLAPYSYFKVSLFDLQSGKLIASKMVNEAVMFADYERGLGDPWEMLDMQGKLNMLITQMKEQIDATVPALVASK